VRRRILWVLVVAVVAMFAAVLALTDGQMRIAFVVALQVAAIFGTDYWWAVAVAQAHELAELHRRQAEDAARAAQRDRVEAVRDEREAMARELHDLVAGHVLAMAIRSEAALSTPPDEAGDRAALQAVRDAGLQAHQALRSMITVLRESDGELTTPLRLEDVDAMVEDARRSGLRVRVERTVSGEMPVPVAHAVARVVRESLANCIRHAAGAAVQVTITGESDRVRVVVRSHGGSSLSGASLRGGELAGSGWGLTLLAERVKALGGEFTAGPAGDDGWTVRADLPVGVLV